MMHLSDAAVLAIFLVIFFGGVAWADRTGITPREGAEHSPER